MMIGILRELNQKPIAYYPIYVKATGSVTGGVLLSQLMYHLGNANGNKVSITDKQLQDECMLSKNEMYSAKKKIKSLPFITIKREGIPAQTIYEIDWEEYISFFEELAGNKITENQDDSLLKFRKQSSGNSGNRITENQEAIIKEYNIENKKRINKESIRVKNTTPSFSEWRDYMIEQFKKRNHELDNEEINIEAELSYNYYKQNDWKVKIDNKYQKMKNWKLTVTNWVLRTIKYNKKRYNKQGRNVLRQITDKEIEEISKDW